MSMDAIHRSCAGLDVQGYVLKRPVSPPGVTTRPQEAAIAIAHTILEAIYYMLQRNEPYRDLGPQHFDKLDPQRLTKYLVKRLQKLGHKVLLEPVA